VNKYPEENWKTLGAWIKRRRLSAGFADLAEWSAAIKRSTRQARGLERGEPVGPKTLQAVADQLLDGDPGPLYDLLDPAGNEEEQRFLNDVLLAESTVNELAKVIHESHQALQGGTRDELLDRTRQLVLLVQQADEATSFAQTAADLGLNARTIHKILGGIVDILFGSGAIASITPDVHPDLPDTVEVIRRGGLITRSLGDTTAAPPTPTERLLNQHRKVGGDDGTQASTQKSELEERRALRDQEVSDEDETVAPAALDTVEGLDEEPGGSDHDES